MLGAGFYYEKFEYDYVPKNIGCGIVEQHEDSISLYVEKLSDDNDHYLDNLRRDKRWRLLPGSNKYSFRGDIASICMAAALEYGILNSMENFNSKSHVPLNLNHL